MRLQKVATVTTIETITDICSAFKKMFYKVCVIEFGLVL